MSTLDIRYNVDVIVKVSKLAAVRKLFDFMCIAGQSTLIPVNDRVRLYYTLAEMDEDGWQGTEPEYLAAELAFSQESKPNRILVGRWDNTAGAVSTVAIDAAGTGYALGDILTVVQADATGCTLEVTGVGTDGAVTAVRVLTRGSAYTIADGLVTTVAPAGGTGCTIEITAVGETAVQAAEALRAANAEWYVLIMTGLNSNDATIKQLAAWAETASPATVYAFTTNSTAVLTTSTTDVFSALKALKYNQTIGMFSTYSASPDGIVGVIAYAMGQMRGKLRNSAFTLNFKSITGIPVEAITATQFSNLVGKNGNVYVNRGEYYDWFQNGTMASGYFFDERIYLDKLANDITLNVSDLLNSVPKVPQTEAGVTQIITAITPACEEALRVGFLAPGKWLGENILELEYGDTLPKGYVIQSEPIADQSEADRAARICPPVYVCVKEAGAIHSCTIGVYVDR